MEVENVFFQDEFVETIRETFSTISMILGERVVQESLHDTTPNNALFWREILQNYHTFALSKLPCICIV